MSDSEYGSLVTQIRGEIAQHSAAFSDDGRTGSCACGWIRNTLDRHGNDALVQYEEHLARAIAGNLLSVVGSPRERPA